MTSTVANQPAVGHANDKGVEKALGIGKSGKLLNTNAHDLQADIEDIRDEFLELRSIYIGRTRHDVMRNGLLGEIVARTPILVYDLPELKQHVDTAFVDLSGKMYISDTFAARLVHEHKQGKDSANFLIRHEADHLRRIHLTRMVDLPPEIANIAQDIRINIDLAKGEAAERFFDAHSRDASPAELLNAIDTYLLELSTTALTIGYAMKIEDHAKYGDRSEEEIGAILMKDWKEPPAMPNRDVSFVDIMEGAAQEADGVHVLLSTGAQLPPSIPPNQMTPTEIKDLSNDLRLIGKSKANPANVTDALLQSAIDRLGAISTHQGVFELDRIHNTGVQAATGSGKTHASGKTGDAYIDGLAPSERLDMAKEVLQQVLSPQPASPLPANPNQGGMTIKDLDRLRSDKGEGDPSKSSQSKGDPDTVPNPNVNRTADHVMSTEKLVGILKDAGVSDLSLERLGYDDLDKLEGEVALAKNGIVGAINKATEDQATVGSRYPGGHLLNYAKAQMLDFFRPVLSWEMAIKKIVDGSGKGSRFAPDEPWTIYHVAASDMGFRSQDEVPYMGSRMPGKEQKPLVFCAIDTSGSVDDSMLKRFVTESLNMARKASRGIAPDVVIVFADTVARGEPVFITERNYKGFLSNGINYGGRGGTSFQASIENIYDMVRPGSKSGYAKRTLDAIVYMTDTGDNVPDPRRLLSKAMSCGLKKLPPTLFLAPKSCFNDAFNTGVKKWANIVWFNTAPGAKQTIKLSDEASSQDRKMASIKPTSSRKP